jgi:hypothetical protein
MEALHGALAKALAERIKDGDTITVAGEERQVPAAASLLNVARQFLRDNGIECDSDNLPRDVANLRDIFQEMDDETGEDGLPVFPN